MSGNTLVVGVGHRRRMGKDTFTTYLIEELRRLRPDLRIGQGAFADKIKETCHSIFAWAGVRDKQWYEDHPEDRTLIIPALGIDVVTLWIRFGTDCVREKICDIAWREALFHEGLTGYDIFVITDMRCPDEAYKIRDLGGYLVRVHNPRAEIVRSKTDDALQHWTDWDRDIQNDQDLSHLQSLAVETTGELCARYDSIQPA